jgi:hypothetical protein
MSRPWKRKGCESDPRPCLYFSCRYNITIDREKPLDLDEDDIPRRLPVYTALTADDELVRIPILVEDAPSNCSLDYDGIDHSEAEVAEHLGITEAEVSAAISSASTKLTHYSIGDGLMDAWAELRSIRR